MNKLLRAFLTGLVVLLMTGTSSIASQIKDFTIEGSERQGQTIELVALDASGNEVSINGAFSFSINGFETKMRFNDGRAYFPTNVASSTFLYLKSRDETGGRARLFYVYGGLPGGFSVVHIPLALLVIVPLALVLLGMFFRRLIILALILLGAFFYFNSSKGLSLESFFDAAREWVSGLVQMVMHF